jgi:hypothetical protein
MGWVVYVEETGRAKGYYRKASTAKGQATRHNNERQWNGKPYPVWLCCSYADYEGVLMGMQEPERKMWAFCRG